MALKQVRVQLAGVWYTAAYNEATGRYEVQTTAPGTSIHQPGGYYSLTAEVTNDAGTTDTITGAQLAGLRLPVRETTAPTLELVSPPAGWLTTPSPTFVFFAQDEAGGSGIDTATAKVTVDGAERPCTVVQDGEGYTVTCPVSGLSEGAHTVTAAISDRDGNETTVSAAYQVDTVPPVLYILQPYQRHVVDWDSVEIVAWAVDPNGAALSIGGAAAEGGRRTVPLEVGENRITITATDGAGNTTTQELYMIRLITDRTTPAPEEVLELVKRPVWEWTSQELAWYNSGVVRGAYNTDDLNRVGLAVRWLTQALAGRGYDTLDTNPHTNWTKNDAPQRSEMETYLSDVTTIRDAQGLPALSALPLPATMRKISTGDANNIEQALVQADAVFPRYSYWTAGELTAGEC